ncbi:MAG: hypothetical protein J07AB43_09590 [Candidatus Nanosalina sp. J07AB43]|jgi:hypothetical protein|nr:MAG: hypothetical protein J07AB43_09590 [Candidatus Nanosalina sp. J07AB43]
MADDIDYEEVLDGTVDEVKEAIDDLDNADYEELLDTEEDGDDRKTVKDYIRSSMDSEEEDEAEETVEESSETEEEIVEDIEEETQGGFLGSFSREAVMAGGLAVGVLIGIVASSYMMPAGGGGASPASVKEDVRVILTGGQPVNGTVDISDPVRRHGMYFLNATVSRETANGTRTQTQGVYVTLDGEKLIPVREQLGRTLMPIDVESTLSQIEAQSQTDRQPSTSQTPESGQSTQTDGETEQETQSGQTSGDGSTGY